MKNFVAALLLLLLAAPTALAEPIKQTNQESVLSSLLKRPVYLRSVHQDDKGVHAWFSGIPEKTVELTELEFSTLYKSLRENIGKFTFSPIDEVVLMTDFDAHFTAIPTGTSSNPKIATFIGIDIIPGSDSGVKTIEDLELPKKGFASEREYLKEAARFLEIRERYRNQSLAADLICRPAEYRQRLYDELSDLRECNRVAYDLDPIVVDYAISQARPGTAVYLDASTGNSGLHKSGSISIGMESYNPKGTGYRSDTRDLFGLAGKWAPRDQVAAENLTAIGQMDEISRRRLAKELSVNRPIVSPRSGEETQAGGVQ